MLLYHWREESQHAILDELEWLREDGRLSAAERDQAVDDLIALVGAVDGILQMQSGADAEYFVGICDRRLREDEQQRVGDGLLEAYRWQYIVSGVQEPRFAGLLGSLITEAQGQRIASALAPMLHCAEAGGRHLAGERGSRAARVRIGSMERPRHPWQDAAPA